MIEARRLNNPSLRSTIIDYVVNRQNEDGGYTFCQGAESNAQDTYYGLAILRLLDSPFPNPERTVSFIGETRFESLYAVYFAAEASILLLGRLGEGMKEKAALTVGSYPFFGSSEVLFEASSEFTTTFMALELADLLKLKVEADGVADWLLSFRNVDGGFGVKGHSDINSTYYVTASLGALKRGLIGREETLRFVRGCEKPHGGFTIVPINYTPYMEHTYYGAMTLDLLGEKCRYPQQTADWILTCQNRNGGFARGDLGISLMVNTYQAVALLLKLA